MKKSLKTFLNLLKYALVLVGVLVLIYDLSLWKRALAVFIVALALHDLQKDPGGFLATLLNPRGW